QVALGLDGGGTAQVGEVVDEDAVVLLGHGAVAAAQPGLEVGQGDLVGVGGQRAGQGGGGVALDQDGVGSQVVELVGQGGDQVAELVTAGGVGGGGEGREGTRVNASHVESWYAVC